VFRIAATFEMLRPRPTMLALALPMFLTPPAAFAAEAVISSSPGLALTASSYREYLAHNPRIDRKKLLADQTLLQDFVMNLHSNQQLLKEAEAAALDKRPEIAGKIEDARTGILVKALMEDLVKDIEYPDFEDLAQERYLADLDQYRSPERRKASHILLSRNPYPCRETRCAAETTVDALVEELKAGGDFAELARRYSLDPGTACAGGALDTWITLNSRKIDETFKQALFRLGAVGDLSDPVVTRFGTHIIRLDALEEGRQLPFEEVEDRIVQQLQEEYRHSLLEQKRAQAYPDWHKIDFEALRKLLSETAAP